MEQKALAMLSDMLLTPQNLGIMVASWFLVSLLRRVFPAFFKKPIMVRLLPLLPVLSCMGMLWLPGLRPSGVEWGWMLILGLVLGWGSGYLHTILKKTVFGKDLFAAPEKEEESESPDSPEVS